MNKIMLLFSCLSIPSYIACSNMRQEDTTVMPTVRYISEISPDTAADLFINACTSGDKTTVSKCLKVRNTNLNLALGFRISVLKKNFDIAAIIARKQLYMISLL